MTPPPLNAGMPWCEHQDAALLSLLENGADAEHIAETLQRTTWAIVSRIHLLAKEGFVQIQYEVMV